MSRSIPFKITEGEHGAPNITLGTIEHLEKFLLAGGLSIVYGDEYAPGLPTVTMTFAPGALDFEFDAMLLSSLLAQARAEQ